MARCVVILDVSFITNCKKILDGAGDDSASRLKEIRGKICGCLQSPSPRDRGFRIVVASARVKREDKLLQGSLGKVVAELLCASLPPWLQARLTSIGRVEDVLAKLCRNARSEVQRIALNAGIGGDPCSSDSGLIRALVDKDIHLALFALYYASSCFDILVATSDKHAADILDSLAANIGDETGHSVSTFYLPRVEQGS